ncbi:MAG: ATP-binding region ATPase domain protein [Gemmatimonadetes bacterium]|nr:ATP-binding region ATPase domain protein [Gemmatimonadota bacterium]
MSPSPTGPNIASVALLELAADLHDPATRATAADALASAMGAQALLIFVRDEEIGVLLPARGFQQTLPDSASWRAFLAESTEKGQAHARLRLRRDGESLHARGYGWGTDAVLVLVGAGDPVSDVTWLRALLPLFAATFHAEHHAALADTHTHLARESAERAEVLARMLDRTRVRLEEALSAARHAQVELEHKARELQASNAKLLEARKLAESASRAKSDFLATMSHELRTPLNAIGGHTQLLQMGLRGPVTPAQKEALERIDRSHRRLLGLINDILNLSRIEAGHVEYDLADVSLRAALDEVLPMIEPQLAEHTLGFEICDPAHLPTVRADREKLEQVLLNLLSNAVKFTDPGGRIWIEAVRSEQLPGKVLINVVDTGLGIPAHKLEYIFEPFTQVDASHSRIGQGTGLGLAISRDLARGMGGDLRAKSDTGKGSTFTLVLDEAGVAARQAK